MLCPYCGYEKDEFTDEHVIPRALGGNLRPTNPFLLRVCAQCNAACGRWIDGVFIRSWFIHNARALAGSLYYDEAVEPIVPITFMGRAKEWDRADEVCDFWLGPTGDHVHHVHRPYPGDLPLVGKPPHVREETIDPGIVYVKLVGTNPEWHPIIMRSIKACFARSKIHYLNAAPEGSRPPWPPVPPDRERDVDWVNALAPERMREVQVTIDVTFGDRFLVKLALGVGSLVLDPSFQGSADAALLRRCLWTKDKVEREKLPIRGTGFLRNQPSLSRVLAWKGCHVFLLKPVDGNLVLSASFYGSHEAMIVVTSESAHYRDRIPETGLVWVLSPGLGRAAGPMPLEEFLAEKSASAPTRALLDLHGRIAAAKQFPPFHAAALAETAGE